MDKEKLKVKQLSDEELAQVSGGKQEISTGDAFNKYCSSYNATESSRLANDKVRCYSCVYFLKESVYYCEINKTPTISGGPV